MSKIIKAVDYIKEITDFAPEIGVILGSGLGDIADQIKNPIYILYNDVPGLPVSQVVGHNNRFVLGELSGKKVIMMQGRFHFYEGFPMEDVAIGVRILIKLGIKQLIVTNAAGSVNINNMPGDLMLISDHINMMGTNPLMGPNDASFGPRFPDMSQAYSKSLIDLAKQIAKDMSLSIKEGVYLAVSGPMYETPAEIRMFRTLGADAVGMSTVPEVIVAAHSGIPVLGISCLTNMAAGILDQPLNHNEVIETSNKVKENFINFVQAILTKM